MVWNISKNIIQSNKIKIALIEVSLLIIVLFISQIYFTMAKTETQPYQIIKTEKDFEIRHYPPATMATILMAAKTYKELSSPGFRKLASFILEGTIAKKIFP